MLAKLIKNLKGILGRDEPADILPPQTQLPRQAQPARMPAPEPQIIAEAQEEATFQLDLPRRKAPPRPEPDLSGRVESVNDHETRLIMSTEATQELLALTEDVIEKMDGEGFDPYNHTETGSFTPTAWDKNTRR